MVLLQVGGSCGGQDLLDREVRPGGEVLVLAQQVVVSAGLIRTILYIALYIGWGILLRRCRFNLKLMLSKYLNTYKGGRLALA